MRKLFAALLLVSFILPSSDAAPNRGTDDSQSPPAAVPKAENPKPSGPSFLERLFSAGPPPKAKPVKHPVHTPTPAPAPKRRVHRPAPPVAEGDETPKPRTPAVAKTNPPKPEKSTEASDPKVNPPTIAKAGVAQTPGDQLPPPPKTKSGKGKGVAKKATPPAKVDVSGMDDAAKFKAVKAQAMEDPELKALKTKADTETNEAAAQKALVGYNRALFKKIREIEPSVSGYSEKVEAAMTKRLSSEKGQQ